MPACPNCNTALPVDPLPAACPGCGKPLRRKKKASAPPPPAEAVSADATASEDQTIVGGASASTEAETLVGASSVSAPSTDARTVAAGNEDQTLVGDAHASSAFEPSEAPTAARASGAFHESKTMDAGDSDRFHENATLAGGDGPASFDSKTIEQTIKEAWGGTVREGMDAGNTIKRDDAPAGAADARPSVLRTVKQRTVVRQGKKKKTPEPGGIADYELLSILGEGGMGTIFTGRQTAIDREIAVKMIKGEAAGQDEHREKFLAEAVVTGDLEHPNIVPVYDLGSDTRGALFYAMKKVKGTPWNKTVRERSRTENLETLMRVADAVAFAHARGVLHRDLKPENVMLGGFGEVLVMDWGMAAAANRASKAERLTRRNAIGGTPAYMAPEMALGDPSAIGPHSDIYLLGAILFEIVAKKPPHAGRDVMDCLMNCGQNVIQPTDEDDELLDIAMTAMATNPADRYATVQDFQAAIRTYQEHSESIALSTQAEKDFARARESGRYSDFNQALFGFNQALELWDGNEDAASGVRAAGFAYAECAFAAGDLDLAESMLDPKDKAHKPLLADVRKERQTREARRKRIRYLTYGTAALLVIVFAGLTVGFFLVRASERQAQKDREKALAAEADARKRKEEAEKARDAAKTAQAQTQEALEEAEEARKLAQKKSEETAAALAKADEAAKAMLQAKDAAAQAEALRKLAESRAETAKMGMERRTDNTWWTFGAAEAARRQAEAAGALGRPARFAFDAGGGASIPFVVVPAGEFAMGSPPTEAGRGGEEQLHPVAITRPFCMAATELTRGQWRAATGEDPPAVEGVDPDPDLPVTRVSRRTVEETLLPALRRRAPEGWTVRLPTEAEWEYACRAGTHTRFHSGDEDASLDEAGWTAASEGARLHPVGALAANAFGLHDMHGNAAEWCADAYEERYYFGSPEADPFNAADVPHRVVRGGAFINLPAHCRSAYRSYAHVENAYPFLGVRLVLAPLPPQEPDNAEPAASPAASSSAAAE